MAELTAAEQTAWRTYIDSSLSLETRLDEDLRATCGLSLIDYHVLVLLSEAPQRRLRMRELADRLVFSRSRVTYQVDSMSKRGLVVREPAPDDARGFRAVLTATGLETLLGAAPKHAASVRALFLDLLDDRDVADLTRMFTKLRAHLT
jgi:DNA-binding MarR family transcriptional regulator